MDRTPPVVYHDKIIIVHPGYVGVLYFYDIMKQKYVLKCELGYQIWGFSLVNEHLLCKVMPYELTSGYCKLALPLSENFGFGDSLVYTTLENVFMPNPF